jgi:hypothetical protein
MALLPYKKKWKKNETTVWYGIHSTCMNLFLSFFRLKT